MSLGASACVPPTPECSARIPPTTVVLLWFSRLPLSGLMMQQMMYMLTMHTRIMNMIRVSMMMLHMRVKLVR